MKVIIICISVLLTLVSEARAQHSIDVQRLSANAEHFDALVAFEKIPKRIVNSQAILAAARSAWALSLPVVAVQDFEAALRDEKLPAGDKARVFLSRAAIEFQEGRNQTTILYVQKVFDHLEEGGPLSAKAWLLWGQALDKMGQYGSAEEKYLKALDDGQIEDKGETYFLLGVCQMHLGKNEEAKINFEKVPLRHERTAQTMRNLAQIALDSQQFSEAEFWLNKGRTDYPEHFLDSWVDYALLQVAVSGEDSEKASLIIDEGRKKYPPSDPWFTLAEAANQSFRWKLLNSSKN